MQRRGWIDYARGIVIIYVVYRHTLTGLINAGVPLQNAVYLIQEASMPVFFIVSGIFIQYSLAKHGFSEFVKHKFNILMYPYFIWATIHLTVQLVFSPYANTEKDPSYYLMILIFPRAIDQFWYLYTLFVVMILFASLNVKVFGFKKLPNILTAFVFYHVAFFVASDWFVLNDSMLYFLFVVFGFLIAPYLLKEDSKFFTSKWSLMIFPLFILLQFVWYRLYADATRLQRLPYDGFLMFIPITIVTALIVFLAAYTLDRLRVLKVLKYLGGYSLYIYIMHLMITGGLRTVLMKAFPELPAGLLLLLVTAGGLFIPILLYQTFIKLKLYFLFEPPVQIRNRKLADSKSR